MKCSGADVGTLGFPLGFFSTVERLTRKNDAVFDYRRLHARLGILLSGRLRISKLDSFEISAIRHGRLSL